MKIAVTGVTGYIGICFAKWAVSEGHEIVALSRRRPELVACDWIPYELSSKQALALPIDTDAVLHLAMIKSPNDQLDGAQEVLAAGLLVQAAQKVSAKFIFVSSQTARSDAPTAYGRIKWRIEQIVLAASGWVVRPGQVYGGMPRGLFGELVKLVQRLSVLPAFMPAPKVQPIHVDDLAAGLLRIAERADIRPGVLCLASPEPVSFTDFLHAIARNRLRLCRCFFPVPALIISTAIRLVREPLRTRTGLERLRSLFDLTVMNTASDLQRLGLQLRPLSSGMHPAGSARRRHLLVEGHALLSYVLRAQPGNAMLGRYVRAIEKLRGGVVLALPGPFVWWPALLALIDRGNRTETAWDKEFLWRLDAATVLAEASPLGARVFLGMGERDGFMGSLFWIARAIAFEASWRILSVSFAPITRVVLPRALAERQ